jgi:hypothetical protein
VRVTWGVFVELEELSQVVDREVTFRVFRCIDDTGRQILLGASNETARGQHQLKEKMGM